MKADNINYLEAFIKKNIANVNTCYPCEVLQVKNTRVEVKILCNDTKDYEFPDVLDIPVIHLKAGNSQITMPTTIGDKGLIFISSKNTKRFKTNTGLYYKVDFDIDNAFYIGGIFNNIDNETAIDLNSITIKKGDSLIKIEDNAITILGGIINLGEGGSGVARIGDSVEVEITSGSSAGTYTGTITSGSAEVLSK